MARLGGTLVTQSDLNNLKAVMPNTNFSRRVRWSTGIIVVALSAPLSSQVVHQDPARTWPVDSVVARLEADVRTNALRSAGSNVVFGILDLPDSYAARKDSLLDRLELLALTSTNFNVRQVAASRIALAGELGRDVPPRQVWARLLRIYRGNSAPIVRSMILDRTPMLAERALL
jgi:hypothetical protein